MSSLMTRRRSARIARTYVISDRLHAERTAEVSCEEIADTVSAWLAELGTSSPMVDDLARAVDAGDWPAAHSIGDFLSVEVTAVAC
jgi:hypothetical protein